MSDSIETYKNDIFNKLFEYSFNTLAMRAFVIQYECCKPYRRYCELLHKSPDNVRQIRNIPFLPIEFFKNNQIVCGEKHRTSVFKSSGTTGTNSYHYVHDLNLYDRNLDEGFRSFYGAPAQFRFIAILPGYIERNDASLIYMLRQLIAAGGHSESGIYSSGDDEVFLKIQKLEAVAQPYFLWAVSHALMKFAEQYPMPVQHCIVMETGGSKGMGKEIIRSEMHGFLKKSFSVKTIHSEYGMTELLSQAYAVSDGIFRPTPRMKVLVRDATDPLCISEAGTGMLNIIDLANIHSCCFIGTSDVGTVQSDGSFELLGRADNSDARGCNQMV
ncbi:MAG: acyltransferase [Bacteroidales bacterium]|nr:acyltransferase [Bacteroidales bacterium]HOY38989.1 acyltransferase [Bacteroidales bacterium]HQP03460.1 acyltransferase [Bacteroidales bacterium]